MTINKNNYEAFFLDYHEGNLSPQQVAELLLFVEQHPELKEEFESFENISLEDYSSVSFDFKADLKKEITIENKDEYFIRAIENNLNTTEQQLLDTFLKQHPQFLSDLEAFRKTKVQPDPSIIFEGKEQLKDIALSNDHVLIAAVEGLLTPQENALLQQQITVDAQMQQDYNLYQQTKLAADVAVVFENKDELKRKESRVIPFYYITAAAAAILLLFGIFYLFNGTTDPTAPEFADKNKTTKTQSVQGSDSVNQQEKAIQENTTVVVPQNATASVEKATNKKSNTVIRSNEKINTPEKVNPVIINNEQENKNLAQSNPEKNVQENPVNAVTNEKPPIANNPESTHPQTPAVAQFIHKEKTGSTDGYLSLGQIAAKKIKEKTLDPESYASEKKAGKLKKFSGWDVLQVVAKGVSKVTGKNVEVKPTYNEAGDVTAYALSAGKLGFSKEK